MGSKVLEVLPTENGGLRIKANANQIFCDYNVAFKGDAGPLEWQVQNGVPNGKYDLVITEGGDAVFRDSGNPSIFLTPQSVAEAIISSLLDSVSQL